MRKIVIILSLAAVMLLLVASGVAVGTSDEADERGVIIGFEERLDRAGRERLVEGVGGRVSHSYTIINAAAAHIPSEAVDGLRRNPHVNYIEDDYTVKVTEQQLPWGVDRIGAPIVHGYNKGTGIKVAILDTGIDWDHPDLSANYKGGIDYANDDGDPMDDNGHGTHCAGIAGAVDNEIGVIGVAPEASLYGVKVMDSGGGGSISDIIAGIEWSVNNSMQIVSMSFGGDYPSEALQDACDAAYNNGVLLVAAAGNDGNWAGVGNSVDYPASYDSVIAVAATDSNNARAPWSSTGPTVELAAPGVGINSTYWDDTYTTKQGTSMACPHVSGTAALVMASDPELSNVEVRERLQTTAYDLGTPGRDELYGFGLVDADEAAPSTGNILPVANAGSDQTAVIDETVEFDGSGSFDSDGTIVSYDWDFGDGETGTGVTTTHEYSTPDTYTVTLTVTDDGGANDTDTADVRVTDPANDPPVADAGSDQTAVIDETVEFDGSGSTDPDGTIVSYDWDFGDGGTGTGVTTTHEYSTPDTYTVTLTVTDDGGANDTDTADVRVTDPANDPPVADAGSDQTAVIDETVEFDGSGSTDPDGTIVSYDWDFGDGGTGTGVTTTHEYSTPDTYTVTLTVTDDGGANDTDTMTVIVAESANDPPVANAGSDQAAVIDHKVKFNGFGSTDPDGTIVSYDWDFGDGGTGTGVATKHAYLTPDTYTVTLTVTDDGGANDTDTADVTVTDPANDPPVADAGSDQTAVIDETVEFDGSGSTDPDGTIVSYDWDFGDGGTGTGVATTHAYSTPDTYTVTLTVTDDGGANDTDTADVTVTDPANDPPVADAGSDQTAVIDETVEFDGSGSFDSDGTIVSYDWDFGDGGTGTGVATTHEYSTPDTYTVTLTVTDDGGASDTDTADVTVTEESPTNTMHVDSIDMNLNSACQGQIYYATARVTIVDATGSPVVGATVSGHWEGATNDQDFGVTAYTGQTPNLRSDIRWQRSTPSGTTFTFVVDGVTKDEWTYNPDANDEAEGDVIVP